MNFLNNKNFDSENLSKSDKKILDYIVKHPQKVEIYTINQLALEVDTSVASVQRLCQKLGYSGFREFKFELGQNLKQQQPNDQSIANYYKNALIETVKSITTDDEDSLALIKALTNKQTNILLGTYYSGVPVFYLYNGLIDLGYTTSYATNVIDGEHLLNTLTEDTTIVVFSIHGLKDKYKNYWGSLLEHKRKNSFLITMNQQTKLQKHFEHTILLPGISLANQFAVDPESIPLVYIEMLLNKIYDKN